MAAQNEKVPGNLFASLRHVRPTHLLDRDLQQAWANFKNMPETGEDETLVNLERPVEGLAEVVELTELSLGSRLV